MSHLYRLIYTSQSVVELTSDELKELAQLARFNNLIHQVTGLLLYGEQQFLQVLEGTRENIETIFARILEDKRHHSIVVVIEEPIKIRSFPNWNMGLTIFSQANDLKEKLIKQCAIDESFTAFTQYNATSIIKAFSRDDFGAYIG